MVPRFYGLILNQVYQYTKYTNQVFIDINLTKHMVSNILMVKVTISVYWPNINFRISLSLIMISVVSPWYGLRRSRWGSIPVGWGWKVQIIPSVANGVYSRALSSTASSCTDLEDARFWIGSENIWGTPICMFFINEYLKCMFLMNEYLRYMFFSPFFCTFFIAWVLEIHDTPIK